MSTELIAALIAFVGVVVSVAVSLYTSMRHTGAELQRLRSEIQNIYATKLLDKRIEVYPNMYLLLSDFMKKIEAGTFSQNDIDQLHRRVSEWNSRNAIFFSGGTGYVSYHFRQLLMELSTIRHEEYQARFETPEAVKELKRRVAEFELGLKSDLGIYAVEFSDLSKRFKSYRDLDEAVTEPR
jgi:hypothetical protein